MKVAEGSIIRLHLVASRKVDGDGQVQNILHQFLWVHTHHDHVVARSVLAQITAAASAE
jgi:hypothetical protein